LGTATERFYGRIFEFGDHSSVPAEAEANVFGNMDDLPNVVDRLAALENKKPGLERLMKAAADHVLRSAEDAFVSARVLVHEDDLYSRNGSDSEQGGYAWARGSA
jgi:hypothetical protein